MAAWLAGTVMAACGGSDVNLHTHAFVASTECGQGPYDVHLVADGTTGGDGVEVVACTPRRISGHVEFTVGSLAVANHTYGTVSDNGRCVGGEPTITTLSTSGTGGIGGAAIGSSGHAAAGPSLVERPFAGSETPVADELCGRLGLTAQQILVTTILERTSENPFIRRGDDLHIRLWSDSPNDLSGVVFMVRQLTSKQTPAQVAKRDRSGERTVAPPNRSEHAAPPAPLVEDRPPQPIATAIWTPGYWTRTGAAWGWVAGFWRDDRVAIPAPRVELPGEPPRRGAIWIGGTWILRAGSYVWITGRWRH